VFNFDHLANDVHFAAGSALSLDVRSVANFVAALR
jgi:hypothetical protein